MNRPGSKSRPAKVLVRDSSLLALDYVSDRPFWVILDATPSTRIPKRLEQSGVESVSLYKGEAEERFWDIAPYLARLDEELLIWLEETRWETAWGIAFVADQSLEQLRRHFRKFLLVTDTKGKKLYFRFYDPRVLPTFLPACNEKELVEFFGPIEEFWAKSQQSDRFSVFRLGAPAEPDEQPVQAEKERAR